MVLKLWEVDNGKVIYLKHTNSKNESRLVKLKDPIEFDRIPISELDKAIELMFRYVSSIKKLDNFVVVNSGKDDKEEARSENTVEIRREKKVEENKVEAKPERKVEGGSLGEEYDKDNKKEVPREVSDKLNLLLNENEGMKNGPQFLINKNMKKGADTVKEMK